MIKSLNHQYLHSNNNLKDERLKINNRSNNIHIDKSPANLSN